MSRRSLRVSPRLTQDCLGGIVQAAYLPGMNNNETKAADRTRVIARLSLDDLAIVDEVADEAGVTREEALQQLLALLLQEHAVTGTVH